MAKVRSGKHNLSDAMINEITAIFGALGDASRLRILRVLLDAEEPLSQGAVADAAGLGQANASKHLACLVRVGLVARTPSGNAVFYSPIHPLVPELCGLVCDHVSGRVRDTYQKLG